MVLTSCYEPLEGYLLVETLFANHIFQESPQVAIVWRLRELQVATVLIEKAKLYLAIVWKCLAECVDVRFSFLLRDEVVFFEFVSASLNALPWQTP